MAANKTRTNNRTSPKTSKKATKKKPAARAQKIKRPTQQTRVRTAHAENFSVWQLALLALIMFVAAYIFASAAIDSGSLWHYALTIGASYIGISFVSRMIKAMIR